MRTGGQIPIALRPRDNPSWIVSRYNSQALTVLWRLSSTGAADDPGSVVTSMAGFEKSSVGKLGEMISGPESVVTAMAGFAVGCFFQPPGRPTAIPAAFR